MGLSWQKANFILGHTINQYIDPRGVTTTPRHPKYQINNINNNQMKMSEFDL